MDELRKHLRASALAMRVVGWGGIVGGPILTFAYAPGFFWGDCRKGFLFLAAHPPSHLHGAHPYLLMIYSLYFAWCILLIRGAKDPKAAASLFDWGVLANIFHSLLMVYQALTVPNEHAHLWADVPLLLGLSAVMWYWHPNRVSVEAGEK